MYNYYLILKLKMHSLTFRVLTFCPKPDVIFTIEIKENIWEQPEAGSVW